MKPYVLSQVPSGDIELFRRIQRAVNDFPDINLGVNESGETIILSCHILGRAIGKVFGLKYVDGFFYPNYQHTWLLTANGNIIDVYPVGILGGPFLLKGSDRYTYSPARWLYKKKRILRGKSKTPSFRRAVRIAVSAVRKAMTED